MIFRCTRLFHATKLATTLMVHAGEVAARTVEIGRLSVRVCWLRARLHSRFLMAARPLNPNDEVGSLATPAVTA